MTRLRTILITLAIVLFAGSALARCPDLIETGCDGGWAWFGLRHDGANVVQGHTVTLPCDDAPMRLDVDSDNVPNEISSLSSLMGMFR